MSKLPKTSNIVNISIQVVPLDPDPYPHVDRAIELIRASGVKHEVGPMETTMEGELDTLLAVARAAHAACLSGDVEHVLTYIKISEAKGGTSIEEKVKKYRR